MLKYQFVAIFADGSTFLQAADDVSTVDPKRSSFFDLKQMIASGKKIAVFMLKNVASGDEHVVDLRTGHFQLGMHEFTLGLMPPPSADVVPELKLIYDRRVAEKRTVTIKLKDDDDGEMGDVLDERREKHTTFLFGWEAVGHDGTKFGPYVVGID